MSTNFAFDGNPNVKTLCLERLRDRRLPDKSSLGIPQYLIPLAIFLCERMGDAAVDFPIRFVEAIPVEADLSGVWDKFAYWLLTDKECGAVRWANEKTSPIIERAGSLYFEKLRGNEVSPFDWQDVFEDTQVYVSAFASTHAPANAAAGVAFAVTQGGNSPLLTMSALDSVLALGAAARYSVPEAVSDAAAYAQYGAMGNRLVELAQTSPAPSGETSHEIERV